MLHVASWIIDQNVGTQNAITLSIVYEISNHLLPMLQRNLFHDIGGENPILTHGLVICKSCNKFLGLAILVIGIQVPWRCALCHQMNMIQHQLFLSTC
jgi:hypothetical protein